MKALKITINCLLLLAVTTTFLPGCKKMLGLNLQENYDYKKKTLDPNINMTAKDFLLKEQMEHPMHQRILYSGG